MKKSKVLTIILCSAFSLILIAVMAVGIATNGFGGIFSMIGDLDNNSYAQEYTYSWEVETDDDFDGLDISWINGPVEIKLGDGDKIEIKEYATRELKDNEKLKLSSSRDVLIIDWNKSVVSFSLFNNLNKKLVVTVPKQFAKGLNIIKCSNTSGMTTCSGFESDNADFSSVSGKINVSDITTEEFKISGTSGAINLSNIVCDKFNGSSISGYIELENLVAENANISTTSGKISVQGKIKEIKANSISGRIEADMSECPKKVDFSSVSGNQKLTIPQNDGFTVGHSSISGGFSSDFPITDVRGKSIYSNGDAKFEFSTTSGSMTILKG